MTKTKNIGKLLAYILMYISFHICKRIARYGIMRDLNNMELQFISGGDLQKPVLQSNFEDVATFLGIGVGAKVGWQTGSTLINWSVGGVKAGQLLGNALGACAGAALGGVVATAAVHYFIPMLTGLVEGN